MAKRTSVQCTFMYVRVTSVRGLWPTRGRFLLKKIYLIWLSLTFNAKNHLNIPDLFSFKNYYLVLMNDFWHHFLTISCKLKKKKTTDDYSRKIYPHLIFVLKTAPMRSRYTFYRTTSSLELDGFKPTKSSLQKFYSDRLTNWGLWLASFI